EALHAFEENTGHITLGYCPDNATHINDYPLFVLVGRFQSDTLRCLPRATASVPGGTSSVTVEPAPTVAFVPAVTGATRDALDPMKLPSSSTVLCLLAPS